MKPRDIEVGAKYRHPDYPGTIYLGCGQRGKRWMGPFVKKCLTIVDDPLPASYVGTQVVGLKVAGEWFWNKFVKITGHANRR